MSEPAPFDALVVDALVFRLHAEPDRERVFRLGALARRADWRSRAEKMLIEAALEVERAAGAAGEETARALLGAALDHVRACAGQEQAQLWYQRAELAG